MTSSVSSGVTLSENHRKVRDSSARKMPIPDYSDELGDVIAAVSICPHCTTWVFAYRSTAAKQKDSDRWDFTCPRCGIDFAMPERKLVFQSLPNEWLLSEVYAA
jgi:hypothetical protein